ncbi:MAG: AEC family transporter [Spirochaetales bacterium]|nr:AEC family transporter [Spirochaetales bacterium]
MFVSLLSTIGYLSLLAALGFVVFRAPWAQRRLLPPFLFIVLKVLFPFYFVVRIPAGWDSASALGWPVLLLLFVLCLAMMTVQGGLARLVTRIKAAAVSQPTSYVLLGAVHNAGFIPLPILERLAPQSILLGMFFYLLAFNVTFWALAVPIIQSGRLDLRRISIRINPPLVGMAIGFVVALTGVYRSVPDTVLSVAGRVGELALDGALIALGGALASIREKLVFDREHWLFAAWRMVLYPAAMLFIVALPWPGLDGSFGWGMRMLLVLQATVPPATQTMVVTRAIGTAEQLRYTGSMILFTYLVSLATIPLFVGLSLAWFV